MAKAPDRVAATSQAVKTAAMQGRRIAPAPGGRPDRPDREAVREALRKNPAIAASTPQNQKPMSKGDRKAEEQKRNITSAFQDVLGRAPTASDLGNPNYATMDPAELRKFLATTPEAHSKGVDATKFGAKVADPANYMGDRLDTYNTIRRHTSGPIYEEEIDLWTNVGKGHGAQLAEANYSGAIQRGQTPNDPDAYKKDPKNYSGGFTEYAIYTPRAVEIMGAEGMKALEGSNAGETIYTPEDTALGKNWQTGKDTVEINGVQYYGSRAMGSGKRGILGSTVKALGGSESLQRQADRVGGQIAAAGMMLTGGGAVFADEAAAIAGGTQGARAWNQTQRGALKSVGFSSKQAGNIVKYGTQAGDIAQKVGAGVVDAMGGAGLASTANQAVEIAEKQALGQDINWRAEAIQAGVTLLTGAFLPGGGVTSSAGKAVGAAQISRNLAQQAVIKGAIQGAAVKLNGGTRSDMYQAAFDSAADTLTSGAYGLGKAAVEGRWEDFAVNVAQTAITNRATGRSSSWTGAITSQFTNAGILAPAWNYATNSQYTGSMALQDLRTSTIGPAGQENLGFGTNQEWRETPAALAARDPQTKAWRWQPGYNALPGAGPVEGFSDRPEIAEGWVQQRGNKYNFVSYDGSKTYGTLTQDQAENYALTAMNDEYNRMNSPGTINFSNSSYTYVPGGESVYSRGRARYGIKTGK